MRALLSVWAVSSRKSGRRFGRSFIGREIGRGGGEKSIRRGEGRRRGEAGSHTARQYGKHLEQLTHRLRTDEAFDISSDLVAGHLAGIGAKPAGSLENAHAEQEIALRREMDV